VYLEQKPPPDPSAGVNPKATPAPGWLKKAPLPFPCFGCMAGEANGRIYVVGGSSGATLSDIQVYDPAKDKWDHRTPLPKIDTGDAGRYGGALGVINGKLYVAGGWRRNPPFPTKTLLIYDLGKDAWSPGKLMPLPSGDSVAGVVHGKLYVYTTGNGSDNCQSLLHVYDPGTNAWSDLASGPRKRSGVTAGGVIDGKLFVVGGHDDQKALAYLDVYDPATNKWTPKQSMPTARTTAAAVVVDGKLYVVGGQEMSGGLHKHLSIVEVYDPATDQWSPLPGLSTPRSSLAVVAVGKTLYAIGGHDGTTNHAVVEALDLTQVEVSSSK
jgi:N-acetylneuraminic acid mutarotase